MEIINFSTVVGRKLCLKCLGKTLLGVATTRKWQGVRLIAGRDGLLTGILLTIYDSHLCNVNTVKM